MRRFIDVIQHDISFFTAFYRDRRGRGRDRMVVGFSTNVVSLNPVYDEVYSMQHYVTNCVCDLLLFPPPIKLTATI